MKLPYWVMIVAASTWWVSAYVQAKEVQGMPPFPTLQTPANRPDGARSFVPHFMPDSNPAPPNRRIPSLAPPKRGDIHPVTPDQAWPKPPAIKPAPRFGKPGADSSSATQPLNMTGSEGMQHLLRTDP